MRIVKHGMAAPFTVKVGDLPGMDRLVQDKKVQDYQIHVCACGLSKHKPFCDGSHMHASNEEEGKLFAYENGDKRIEIDQGECRKCASLPNEYQEGKQ